MITVYLYNYIQTVSNQVHTQNLTYNYTIIMYTNLNINLYSSMYIQISETTFSTFIIKVLHHSLSKEICEEIILLYESDLKNKYEGTTGGGTNKEVKHTQDLVIPNDEIWSNIHKFLNRELKENVDNYMNGLNETNMVSSTGEKYIAFPMLQTQVYGCRATKKICVANFTFSSEAFLRLFVFHFVSFYVLLSISASQNLASYSNYNHKHRIKILWGLFGAKFVSFVSCFHVFMRKLILFS